MEPLISILKDKDEDIGVREKAAKALGKIKDERTIESLIAALKDEDVDLRWRAAEEYRKMAYSDRLHGRPIALNIRIEGFKTRAVTYTIRLNEWFRTL